LKTLLAYFPKDSKNTDSSGNPLDRGRYLFDAFRPCYIRAFADAKANSGKEFEGTKTATGDDFVSKGEFRLFCAYMCIYATMFDAFSLIDGGGAGRDANEDRRIELGPTKRGWWLIM